MDLSNIKVLFGGAFNPPTKAHFEIGLKFVEMNASITFMPTSSIYNKNIEIIDYQHRFEMLKIVADKINSLILEEKVYISNYEQNQSIYKGTYETLKDFKDYHFLIGYDQFNNLANWLNFEKLVSENKFIVIPRKGYDIEEALTNQIIKDNINNFLFVDISVDGQSSTKFRKTKDSNVVIDEVYEYIKKNKLYEVE